jgi:hypothetical protein
MSSVADISHDMPEDGFHEIHLSGKQLVFLFMLTTFVAVAIFLCGVLVGRGARTPRAADATLASTVTPSPAPPAEQPAAQPRPVPAEPPSPPADDELSYRKRLEGEGAAPDDKLKPPTDAPKAAPPTDAPPPAPAQPKATETPRAATPPQPVATSSRGGRPGRWVVQLVALRDRGAASSIVQRLSGKGYPAFVVDPSSAAPNAVYKVQVGRYDDKREAEQVARRLEKEEKFNPWISR